MISHHRTDANVIPILIMSAVLLTAPAIKKKMAAITIAIAPIVVISALLE